MRIGTSVFLIAVGAILAFAVEADIPFLSLDIIGYILIAAGIFGLIWVLIAANRSRTTETRTLHDPQTGEHVTRSRSHDGL